MSISGAISLSPTDALFTASIIFLSSGAYNVLELIFLISNTFERFRGLYFYSCVGATIALAVHLTTGYIYLFVLGHGWLNVVLYARLHLVLPHSPRVLRAILFMIIISTTALVPAQTYYYICDTAACRAARYPGLGVFSIIRVVREMLVCGVFMVQAIRGLRPITAVKGPVGRKVLVRLILVQVAVAILDVGLIVAALHTDRRAARISYSGFAQSLKLKMEFVILNSLKRLLSSPVEV
ncbi:hypothetical protein BJY01DRAFT_245060 [Aspergillus pseudoustus]|uniref:DUF7703 domain-containing protein n=1 Tax=Aspergillus pseudoustus TaxID=1810923 RepID=A0ABR4KFR1_9EURO